MCHPPPQTTEPQLDRVPRMRRSPKAMCSFAVCFGRSAMMFCAQRVKKRESVHMEREVERVRVVSERS